MNETKPAGKLESFQIQPATKADVPVILGFIKKLADYERLSHEVSATEQSLTETLFGRRRTGGRNRLLQATAGLLYAVFPQLFDLPWAPGNLYRRSLRR